MIFLYTGKTGSGKTDQMTKDVYPRWRNGDDIYSNTILFYERFGGKAGSNIIENPEYFTTWEKGVEIIRRKWLLDAREKVLPMLRPLIVFFLRDWKYVEKEYVPAHRGHIVYYDDITELIEIRNGVILMDEGQNLLDAYNWENTPPEFRNKLRQHRKHRLDLYATTQNMGTIDINMRRLVQGWVHCKDVFALLWKRNPSLFTIHIREKKDIDFLYNKVDDLLVPNLSSSIFFIHFLKRRLYDTMFDIGFKCFKICWLEDKGRRQCLIIPTHWSMTQARTESLLMDFFVKPKINKYAK